MRKAIAIVLLLAASCAAADITSRNVKFMSYPGFPDAHSTWGSIGYSTIHDKVYIGVTNHRDRQGLYEYDPGSGSLSLSGFVGDLAHLRGFQWQGKIHTQIVEGPDGAMYFGGDGGEMREESFKEHPTGYGGGFLYKWEPTERRLTNLGMGLPYEGIKDITIDRISGRLMAVTYPQVHLLTYDVRKNDLRDLGRMGSAHVPRVLFSDWWGNMYYVDWRQRLIKYEHGTGTLLVAAESLPAFPGTPGDYIITGLTAYATDKPAGVIYLITYGAKMLAFHPQEKGIGKVEDLGGIFDDPGRPPHQYYCPNLALGRNGKLYYLLGGHGMYAGSAEGVRLMEFDPAARTKRTVLTYPINELEEATGSDVRDRAGVLYFAGRRTDVTAARMGESGASRPFLIIFNPEEAVR